MTAKYNVGIVGCGRQGTQHGRGFNLLPDTQVVAIADPDPDNLELATRRFSARGYSTAEEMYANERLDIVDCVLPVQYNPDMVVLAAERSGAKGIVSEKPIAASLADADRMVAACEVNGIPWQGGNVDRSISQLWEARAMIEAGEIGEVLTIDLYESIMQGGCQGLSVAHMFAQDADIDWVTGWTNATPSERATTSTSVSAATSATPTASSASFKRRPPPCGDWSSPAPRASRDRQAPSPFLPQGRRRPPLQSAIRRLPRPSSRSPPCRRRVRRGRLALPWRPARELHAVHRRRHHPRH